ncbi:hypothetical protein [Methyloceanibacter superfactus]|uniref:hypothetical protein n=1 Tax=Methyloceanibacter superfactus TaxID=1774969 RepID=UPI001FCCD4E3|nr:hypothetical protein [Methyloceanibacter superfactus]
MTGEILVAVEHRQGALSPASLETIAAAIELKGDTDRSIAVAVIAEKPDDFVAQVSKAGVDE